MLRITLNKDDQYGEDGPQSGAKGMVILIHKHPDGDYWAMVVFDDFEYNYWLPLDYVLYPKKDFTETYWSTDV